MNRLAEFILGRGNIEKANKLDQEISAVNSANMQKTLSIQSGARVIQTMAGAMKIVAEPRHNEK